MIAIVDYGMGNLRSAQKALERVGHEAVVTDDKSVILSADGVVLPGVGAYVDCYEGLEQRGLVDVVQESAASGRPFLGICVGLQLMFEGSDEGRGTDKGLGIFKGRCKRFPPTQDTGLKVPHMGWNELEVRKDSPLLTKSDHPYVYFVHSYYAQPADPDVILAQCNYGVDFAAVVGRDNVYAAQFHPEKSQKQGLKLLAAFGQLVQRQS